MFGPSLRHPRRSRPPARLLAPALACLLAARGAAGQSAGDAAAAQALYDEARVLVEAGKFGEACPKLEESQRLDPGTGTLLNLGNCYEQTGRLASAWSTYLEAAASAKRTGNPEREESARGLAAALAPRVSKLIIVVDAGAKVDGLEVRRDGTLVGAPQWGLAIPADAGEHTIAAAAPGHVAWSEPVNVEGEGQTTTVNVPKLAPAAVSAAVPEATTKTGAAEPEQDPSSGGLGTQHIVALAVAGVGVVGLGVGTFFGVQSMSKHSDAEEFCDGAACTDPRGVTAGEDAYAAGNIATIALSAGGALVATGVVLWLTAPDASAPSEVAFGLGGVRWRQAW